MSQIKTPDWVKDAIFYQIFPDRFARSSRVLKPNNLEAWDSLPTTYGYKGGDLWGVIEHLDHIQELGANAILFTPIFMSASNHRYHTMDYYQVDPLLGGNRAFEALRDELHRRGMKLVLDGVFNHASRGIYYFNDILENGRNSAWLDWFTVYDWPLSPYDDSKPANYEAWINLRALPKWNTDNPRVREYLMQVAEHWLHEGIDGWRLDVPFCITSGGFWNEFRQRVKAINPEAYIVGEVWWNGINYLGGDQFDAVMNYLFTEPVIQFAGQNHLDYTLLRGGAAYYPYPAIPAYAFADRIGKLLSLYDWQVTQVQYNLINSHDTPRLLTITQGDAASVKLATILLLTFPGAPGIYYGDEIGLPGAADPDNRRTFPWDNRAAWNMETLAYHKELIRLRHEHPALRRGNYLRLHADQWTYASARQFEHEALIAAVNVNDQPETVAIPVNSLFPDGTRLTAVFGQASAVIENGSIRLTIPARDGLILAEAAS